MKIIAMKNIHSIGYFLIFIGFALTSSGQSIVSVLKKEDFVRQDNFGNWKREILNVEKKIRDVNESWLYKSAVHYPNKLFLIVNVLPKDKSKIVTVFDEAVNYEPHGFCEKYIDEVDRHRKFHPIIKSYFIDELFYMDSVCLAILSYDNNLIKDILELEKWITDYRSSSFHIGNKNSEMKQKSADQEAWKLAQAITNRVGIPGRDLVGVEYENVMWQTIYHQEKEIIEGYLPKIRIMVDQRKLDPKAYPILYDKLCYLNDEPQFYGTFNIWNDETQKMERYVTRDLESLEGRREKYALW